MKCSFVRIVFSAIFLSKCFGSIQDKPKSLKAEEKMESECAELLINTEKYSQEEEIFKRSKKFSMKNNPFVYRKMNINESMEKIELMDNETALKSAYIPVISSELVLKNSGSGKELSDYDLGKKNESVPKIDPAVSVNSTKENFVIKNGKKYRVVKVKKNVKSIHEKQFKNQMQRRSFKPLPSLLSILPLKWMTRQGRNETRPERESENVTQWSKLMPVQNSKGILNNETHGSGKIKRLLNLFTIVKFDHGECYANGIKGTCLHQVECEAKGGRFIATCAENLGVCCYSEKTCGETSNDDSTFFINEGFPDSSTAAPKVCTLTLEKANSDVKQLRLDFQIFQLREPTNGTCLHDRLIISGQDTNDVVPEICGTNTGQHVYVDIEDSSGPFNLNIVTVGEYYPRNFRIKVTQVKKDDELIAPKNCLQYYAEPTGIVQTFNYQQDIKDSEDEIVNGYFNNLNYAICIKKQKGFCSISYENEEIDDKHPTFQLVNIDEDGERLLPPRQAGAESFDCPDDYIIINGIRLCGEKLNDASIEVDYTRNYPVTDTTNGPFMLSVRTDTAMSGRGFYLKYVQNPCLAKQQSR